MQIGYPFPYGVSVYVQKPVAVTDPYSEEEVRRDWTQMTEVEYESCAVVPRSPEEGREPLVSGRTPVYIGVYIIGPYDMEVGPHDRVRIADEVFEVEGDPVKWRSPITGNILGTQVNLLRMEG